MSETYVEKVVYITEKNWPRLEAAAARDSRPVNHILNKAVEAYNRKPRSK